jgi:NTP pyrophosphatase (non-canonical NTP hydrolase)
VELQEAQKLVLEYAKERAWDINTPSQRVTHLIGEIGPLARMVLAEEGVWTGAEGKSLERQVGHVFFSLVMLANTLDIDLEAALKASMASNAEYNPPETTKEMCLQMYRERAPKLLTELN